MGTWTDICHCVSGSKIIFYYDMVRNYTCSFFRERMVERDALSNGKAEWATPYFISSNTGY